MEACDEVLVWCLEEWEKGNRIKASKLKRISKEMERKHDQWEVKRIAKRMRQYY